MTSLLLQSDQTEQNQTEIDLFLLLQSESGGVKSPVFVSVVSGAVRVTGGQQGETSAQRVYSSTDRMKLWFHVTFKQLLTPDLG